MERGGGGGRGRGKGRGREREIEGKREIEGRGKQRERNISMTVQSRREIKAMPILTVRKKNIKTTVAATVMEITWIRIDHSNPSVLALSALFVCSSNELFCCGPLVSDQIVLESMISIRRRRPSRLDYINSCVDPKHARHTLDIHRPCSYTPPRPFQIYIHHNPHRGKKGAASTYTPIQRNHPAPHHGTKEMKCTRRV